MSKADELQKLHELHQQGVLSDDEFAAEKAKLLASDEAEAPAQPAVPAPATAPPAPPAAPAPAAAPQYAAPPPPTKSSATPIVLIVVGVVLLLFVLLGAIIAVPAFLKYQRRALTTEAIDQLDKVYKSSSYYYTAPRVMRDTGQKLPCQFPRDQGITPDVTGLNCCGGLNDLDGDERCDVDTTQWTTETWSALNFQMNDQHYFGYSYASAGTVAAARFTATANADLDCDGTLSTFQRYGYGDESASFAECSMKGSSAFYKNNETE